MLLRLGSMYSSGIVEAQRYEAYKNRKAFIKYITNRRSKHKR